MELYVIRHGQSEANVEVRHAGWSTVPLTKQGREEALALRQKLEPIKFDAVYCSDLVRARQTADLALPGYSYQLCPNLREINVGRLTDKRVDDCFQELGEPYRLSRKTQDFSRYGGESKEQLIKRVAEFMEGLTAYPESFRIAAVSHRNTLFAMLSYVWKCSLRPEEVTVPNGSIVRFRYSDGEWTLLEGTGIPERK